MPTLITSYFAASPVAGDTSTLSTPSFTPSAGEVIVVKAATWDTSVTSGTPSGGSQTYTRYATGPTTGFFCYSTIFAATVTGSPGSMSVTLSAPSATSYHSMTVERWSSAQLAATPATNSVISGNGVASTTITTTAANSVITWVDTDDRSNTTVGRAYLSGATEDGLADGSGSTNSVHYYAYQSAATAGSQTMGMSTPNNQIWSIIGIEILDMQVITNVPATVWLLSA